MTMVQSNSTDKKQVIETLQKVSFFSTFSEDIEVMDKIASLCSRKSFNAGKMIIKEGEYGDDLFILMSGKIEILKNTLQNETYTVTTLDAKIGGINVGELALIDNDQRSASVLAKTDCECLVIDRDDFIKFGNENPFIGLEITRAIASQLSSKLRKTNVDVITLFSALVEEIDTE